jgi:hypothetical protein
MSTTSKAHDRGASGKLLLKYRRFYGVPFPQGTPKWWRKLYMTRPKRRDNKRICSLILRGTDPDGVVMPLGNCKPHEYYW